MQALAASPDIKEFYLGQATHGLAEKRKHGEKNMEYASPRAPQPVSLPTIKTLKTMPISPPYGGVGLRAWPLPAHAKSILGSGNLFLE